jgi:peptidoglycan hydrolase CwlO-like protein
MSDKNDNDHYEGALLEDINHKLDAIMEGQQAMASLPGDVAQLKEDMSDVKNDLEAIKAVAREHSELLSEHTLSLLGHDRRLTRLEAA